MRTREQVLTMQVDITSLSHAVDTVSQWAERQESRYVCVSNVHMCVETYEKPTFRQTVNQADLVVPDGRPIYWAQHLLGNSKAGHVRGMDLTMALCQIAEEKQLNVGFYGGEPYTLEVLQKRLRAQYPDLPISTAISPPFRALSEAEQQADINAINDAGTQILFVGLGCPKQEQWMADHKGLLNCTMLGVGAAFDFIAGNKSPAPVWMQRMGLEWLHRLYDEPQRLWRRYLHTNPKFIGLFLLQLIGKKFHT